MQPGFNSERPASLASAPNLSVAWSEHVGDYPTALTTTSDGGLLAVGTSRGDILVLDGPTGGLRFRGLVHPGGVSGASFSPAARTLLTSGQHGGAKLLDEVGELRAELVTGGQGIAEVTWAPHGRYFAMRSGLTVSVGTVDGAVWFEARPEVGTISGIRFSKDGERLAAAGEHGVRILDGRSGKHLRHLAWARPLVALSWSPDDAVIACGTRASGVHFWRLPSGKGSQISGYAAEPRALAWDAESTLLATGGAAVVSVWSFADEGPEGRRPTLLSGHEALCTALAFHAEVPLLASGGDDTSVLLWDLRQADAPLVGRGQLGETVTGLSWIGSERLVACDAEGTVRAWSVG